LFNKINAIFLQKLLNATEPFLLWVSKNMARNHFVKGSFVASNTVPAIEEH